MLDSKGECDRPWEELIPDALALIFKKMSFQEILTVVPAVCKSWRKVVLQPDCWQEIDIEDWCRRCTPEAMERMVKMLVHRSRGSMRKLSVFGLTNDPIFDFITSYANSLQALRMPMSEVTDSIATQVAPKLANLTYLDISCCEKMTSSSLESLGKNCKLLIRLSRNMHPQGTVGQDPKDDEAFAIANHMSRLKHLELAYGLLTDAGMEALLSMCKELEHLDIRGCWNVAMQDSLADQCRKLKVFLGPVVDSDRYDLEDYHSYDDEYDSMSEYDYDYYPRDYEEEFYESDDAWDEDLDGIQLRVYDGTVSNDSDDSDWPTSPRS
ncbi:F-box protein FBW2 [Cryptomeria japonica]|uniref:F-box protein FBW2 n=1 Tax=Cryptomeria japonica TaxID=3369 RepID=UPI0025ABE2C5|nr:F-box protein FBW2 [Cryptomeria japonica]